MRLIDADALKLKLLYWQEEISKFYGETDEYVCCLDDVIETYIENAPTIDAVPVVHGEWIDGTCGCYKICSNCDQISDFDFDYCPHCGAKMDKVSE